MSALIQSVFFALNRLIGSRCGSCYRELLAWERLSPEELSQRRAARLESVLQHAVTNVPFYREHVTPSKPIGLQSFPILTRDEIHSRFGDLMSERLRREYDGKEPRQHRYSWLKVSTGGSTGTPTTVIHDRDFRDFDRAARLYAMHLCEFSFGTPYFRLWGSMKDINQIKDSAAHRLVGLFGREVLLNAFQMEAGDMTRYLHDIDRSPVRHMMAYVDAAYQLAQHARRSNLRAKPLESVMACGGTVTPDIRQTIEDVFETRVHNKYGSRDCGDIACECRENGMHIFANRYVVEVVNEEGQTLPAGEVGRLLITVLGNGGFPLIRYEIGDMGALSDAACPCGRSFPCLASVEGRTMEFLKGTAGGHVSPVYIRHLLGVVHNPGYLRRFQLIQEDAVRFTLKLEWDPDVGVEQTREPVTRILDDLRRVLGADARISVERTERITESQSGKFFATMRRTSQGDAAI